jgi:hypothetical protein
MQASPGGPQGHNHAGIAPSAAGRQQRPNDHMVALRREQMSEEFILS